jgi:hypothetical protein
MRPIVKSLFLCFVLVMAGLVQGQTPSTQTPVRIDGVVVKADPDAIVIRHASGEVVTIAAAPGVPVIAFRKLALADIHSGDFVGVGAKIGPDGQQRAIQVVVFPESMRGTGEGHRGWSQGSDSTMTNANVDAVVEARSGRDLKLSYRGGAQQITVPPEANIITFVAAQRADVQAGKKALVNATDDGNGHYTAMRIAIEKDGVEPPH